MRLNCWVILLIAGALPYSASAACNCGSIDSSNPCTGQSINITVTAGTPNGGNAVDSQYTWGFNSGGGDARCGQFANGDYWIAPAPGQTSVTINSITSNGTVSADVNPTTESMGLLSGTKGYGNYSSGENIIPSLPHSYSATTSIVAAVQRNETTEGNCGTPGTFGECVDSYAVVTILPTVPALAGAETIRPNITGESKEIITFSDLDLTRIPSKPYLTGTNTAGIEAIRQRWSHSTEIFGLYNSVGTSAGYCSEGGRAFRSHILLDDYGGGVAVSWYNDLMNLFSDDNTLAEKKPAIAAMLAYGLDIYHAMYDSPTGVIRYWGTGATQHPGKFMPPVFLAALALDKKYADVLKTANAHAHDTVNSGPLELAQIHTGSNGVVWGDTAKFTGIQYQGAYWSSLFLSQCYDGASGTCDTNYGVKTQNDPYKYIDGPPNKPGDGYMSLSLGVQKAMVATMFVMPEVYQIVNSEEIVRYVDRTVLHGVQAANDPCVTPDSRENPTTCDAYRNTGCVYYGVTWGPVDPENPNSHCITTPTPPYTKQGRFTGIDGSSIIPSYTTAQVEANWEAIMAMRPPARRLFRNVRLHTEVEP